MNKPCKEPWACLRSIQKRAKAVIDKVMEVQ
jgi:hypothetical protein